MLLKACGHADVGLVNCLQVGFPFAGRLPVCGVSVRPGIPKPIGRMSLEELRGRRAEFNDQVIANLRRSEWTQDLMAETMKDVAFGAMRGPWRLCDTDFSSRLVSRQMPVREERAAGWKTRIVDDCTESGINVATQACEKLRNDSIDVLVLTLRRLTLGRPEPLLGKRDIASAFRRLPVSHHHLDSHTSSFSLRQ